MTTAEREVIFELLATGCPSHLPKNVHMSLDLLRREIEVPAAEVIATLRGIGSLGFHVEITDREADEHDLDPGDQLVTIEWHDMYVYDDVEHLGPATDIAVAMVTLILRERCPTCALNAIRELDFSPLSRAA